MREIRFRGQRLFDSYGGEEGEWVYGCLHVIDTLGNGYTGTAIQVQCGTSRPWSVRVDPETVGQFTGRKDDNGVNTYEHDIVRDGNGKVFVVRCSGGTGNQSNGCGGFNNFGCYTKTKDGYWEHAKVVSFVGMVVIGNVHDNPELLGGDSHD